MKEQVIANGWTEKSLNDFFELSPAQISFVDLKSMLRKEVKQRRIKKEITQTSLARLMGSSQSRIAKLEGGDPAVTIDLQLRALFALDVTLKELGLILYSAAVKEDFKSQSHDIATMNQKYLQFAEIKTALDKAQRTRQKYDYVLTKYFKVKFGACKETSNLADETHEPGHVFADWIEVSGILDRKTPSDVDNLDSKREQTSHASAR